MLFSSCLVSFVFLVLGFDQKSFTFEFGGIAGLLLTDEQRKTSYSVLTLGSAIRHSAENPQDVGIFFLQISYYFYAVVMPVCCLMLLIILLIYPLPLKKQRQLLIYAEIANAWSGTEVFLLSIVAALLQISTFASFMIGDKCDLINELATEFVNNATSTTDGGDADAGPGPTVCFTVDASVESNCWYLIVGVILNWLVVSVGLKFCHEAIVERLDRANALSSSLSSSLYGGSNASTARTLSKESTGNDTDDGGSSTIVSVFGFLGNQSNVFSRIVFGDPIPGYGNDDDHDCHHLHGNDENENLLVNHGNGER